MDFTSKQKSHETMTRYRQVYSKNYNSKENEPETNWIESNQPETFVTELNAVNVILPENKNTGQVMIFLLANQKSSEP